ncbi:hypothetical protein BDV41DRAFT_577630 [Aspergillus transmontanensis]|uniref:Azaphilone pigments biosynthesis cluster protein L N-terminal domain-containing protein n=1 Tax=Aspergillus transmontanensis TaxID=1034304 RepID=A0A5N6VVA0_9EURO|nr:hypothetical protein BDV41DRAFT_577630 [Aspergillus transmontanensis]
MVDPFSLATGLLALATFAYGACQSVGREFQSFEDQPKDICHLKSQLKSLTAVLGSLISVVREPGAETDTDLVSLKAPLLGCGEACKDLEDLIRKCTKHSDGKGSSVRTWLNLKVRADEIKSIQNILSVYQETITLALATVTLRTSRVTKHALDGYNKIVQETTSKLNEHIRRIDDRMKSLPFQGITAVNEKEELARALREKFRVKQCLDICRQIHQSINRGHSAVLLDGALPSYNTRYACTETLDTNLTADETTMRYLDHLTLNTEATLAKLEQRARFVQDRLRNFPGNVVEEFEEIFEESHKRQNERDYLMGCLSICENATQRSEQARTNVFENIHAAERAKQAVISDVGDLILAKGIRADMDSEQVLGQTTSSPFLDSRDPRTRKKPTERNSSSSKDMNEIYQSRKFIALGSSSAICHLKNLLLVVLFAILLRNL